MSLQLITGHSGNAHITAADFGALNACIIGQNDYVMESGENFAPSVITNNLVRIYDGEAMMQGRHIRLARGTYEDITIENGAQEMNRNDLIVIRYEKNADTGVETSSFAVIKGMATTGTAADPEYTTGDILSGDCLLHEMPLYRIPLVGLNVGTPVPLFKTVRESGDALAKLGGVDKNKIVDLKGNIANIPSTDIKDMGTITIPANSLVCISAIQRYGSYKPIEIRLFVHNELQSCAFYATNNTYVPTPTLTFFAKKETTIVVQASYNTTGTSNAHININGFYIPL